MTVCSLGLSGNSSFQHDAGSWDSRKGVLRKLKWHVNTIFPIHKHKKINRHTNTNTHTIHLGSICQVPWEVFKQMPQVQWEKSKYQNKFWCCYKKNLEEIYFSFSWEDQGCIPCQGYLEMERISLWSH